MNALRNRGDAVDRSHSPLGRNRSRGSAAAVVCAFGVLVAASAPGGSAAAQEPREARKDAPAQPPSEAPIAGVWPDIALTVGAGIGIDEPIGTNVLARLRLGALFAYEPWVLNVGATAELGALAEHGVGLELELNHMSGPWLQINASRVEPGRFMGHLGLGYFVFGVEWQHAFGEPSQDALLFVLRLPIGILWFLPQQAARSEAGG